MKCSSGRIVKQQRLRAKWLIILRRNRFVWDKLSGNVIEQRRYTSVEVVINAYFEMFDDFTCKNFRDWEEGGGGESRLLLALPG